ncbi:MAG: DNA-binding response regulator, partial [candidate division NC10 bacterium]|nr:DNA-binding response regulator [candidate division NC10 bacterium]
MKAHPTRVLLVDNDRFILEAVGDLLREAGYAVE